MIRLLDQPHVESRRLLATGAPVYLLVNPVEYHGPHLSLHNDALISRGLMTDLHAALAAKHPEWPLLVADDLEMGVEPAPGPGTRRTPFSLARKQIAEACRALAELGAQRVVLVTFHGAPLHNIALEEGVGLLARLGVRALNPMHLVLHELLAADPAKFTDTLAAAPEAERAGLLAGIPHDFHAGFVETSLALHYAPESVSPIHKTLPPCPPLPQNPFAKAAAAIAGKVGARGLARDLTFAAAGMGWYALRPFPGYTGKPHLASAACGAAFAREIIRVWSEAAEAVFAGTAPAPTPIMPWTRVATLGGRIGGLDVPISEVAG